MEPALMLHEEATRQNLEQHLNVDITDLAGAKEALVQLTEEYIANGIVGIKLAHAYTRTLHSVSVPEPRAVGLFAKALGGTPLGAAELKDLQDHIIFFLAELAQDKDLVFQIHTGVQGNWGNIPDSDPLLLIPLLKAFPQVRFDLFHAGYPYARMLGMLGKHFPNVWLNMAWMYIVSIAASRQILSEWIDLVPGYRILGFGSDVHFPEMIIGHLDMARSCVAGVLADKVREDFLSEEEAFCLAHKMFRDNGLELYGLSRRSQGT
jgi:predicted TIM-barrel fold metal-dependent hydrolase